MSSLQGRGHFPLRGGFLSAASSVKPVRVTGGVPDGPVLQRRYKIPVLQSYRLKFALANLVSLTEIPKLLRERKHYIIYQVGDYVVSLRLNNHHG